MLLFDGHCDSLSAPITDEFSLNTAHSARQLDFASAVGVMDFQTMAIFIDKPNREAIVYDDFLPLAERLHRTVADNDQVTLITAKAQLADWSQGPLGVLMAVEGGEILQGEVSRLAEIYRLGVRSLTLTWNNANALAYGCLADSGAQGLTVLGKQVVREMNRLGMAVDIAHLNQRGVFDVLSLSDAPVIDSHGSCRARFDHPRNLSDDAIKALAATDGVLGITYVAKFLREPYQQAAIDDVIDHIVHAAYLVGVEHVGLGSDFDGVDFLLPGLERVGQVPSLVDKLAAKGFRQDEIAKIMGGNFLRVYGKILH